jgi:hypothetical protein
MMAMRMTAAPLIAMPAIPPVLSLSEPVVAALAGGVAKPPVPLGAAVMVATDVTVVGLLLVTPPAVRFA